MDMRVHLTEEQFASLSGFALGRELIQPAIQQSRGQRLETKKSVYDCLTPGQKSLFGFWVLYGHTQSGWLPFFQEGLYIGGYEPFLPMIKAGLRHIEDQALVENITQAEVLYSRYRESLQSSQGRPLLMKSPSPLLRPARACSRCCQKRCTSWKPTSAPGRKSS